MTQGRPTARFYRGDSMAGTLRPGDYLALLPAPPDEIHSGDVVVFRHIGTGSAPEEIAHRVVAMRRGRFVTRGDNNPQADVDSVAPQDIVGRVVSLQRTGRTHVVRGGWSGRCRALLLHTRLAVWRVLQRVGRRLYGWLRASGVIARVWRPPIVRMHFATNSGPQVKYVCRGRTVATWQPELGRWQCRKPFDLVLWRDYVAGRSRRGVPAEREQASAELATPPAA